MEEKWLKYQTLPQLFTFENNNLKKIVYLTFRSGLSKTIFS